MNRKEYTEKDFAAICQMLEQAYADKANGESVKEIARRFTDKYPEDVVMAVIDTVVETAVTIKQLKTEFSEGYEGVYVKQPIAVCHNYCTFNDFSSLYPIPTDEMLEIICKKGVDEMNKCLRKIQENENVKN
jgi:hypothetical protein